MGLAESHGFLLLCTSLFMQSNKSTHLTSSILHGQDWNTSPQNNNSEKKTATTNIWQICLQQFDTWRIKPLWFLDIILVCLFGAVEESILVLSHELLKDSMEAWGENSHVTQHLHHVESSNLTNIRTKKWISIRNLNWSATQYQKYFILHFEYKFRSRLPVSAQTLTQTHKHTQNNMLNCVKWSGALI